MTLEYHSSTQPDILEVIADLSNDEVRTPPSVANAVLDLLPEEVWANPDLRWLDPGTKTGVFLREITKRLMVGLAQSIPDEKQRLTHILQKQVFGIAITELTGLMARRTLYCSKDAAGKRSVVQMPTSAGNIWFGRTRHLFAKGRCSICGATEDKFDSATGENYAYAFIHEDGRLRYQEDHEMKFDVIVGNPPYQMDADALGQNVVPIYQKFVEAAVKLEPRFISFVVPSRWMAGGRALGDLKDLLLKSGKISHLVDFPNASEIFANVEIKGGVCYFLWDSEHVGECKTWVHRDGVLSQPLSRTLDEFDVFVRDPLAIPILKKVLQKANGKTFSDIVSMRDPFGPALGSNLKDFRTEANKKVTDIQCLMNEGSKRNVVWVDPQLVSKNHQLVDSWKVLMPRAGSDGGQKIPDVVTGKPQIAGPGVVCTATYLCVGPFGSRADAERILIYLTTRFARFLLSLRKITQNTTQGMFLWVPKLPSGVEPDDASLFDYFGLTDAERAHVVSVVKELEL